MLKKYNNPYLEVDKMKDELHQYIEVTKPRSDLHQENEVKNIYMNTSPAHKGSLMGSTTKNFNINFAQSTKNTSPSLDDSTIMNGTMSLFNRT